MIDKQKNLKEILVTMYEENVTQCRHHETQRSAVTSSILTIDTIIIGLITFDKAITSSDIPLSIFLFFIGLFGAGFSLKHYERYSLHLQRAREFRNKIDELFADNLILSLKIKADNEHEKYFPKFRKYRHHFWWIGIHLIVAAIGVTLTLIAIFFHQIAV